MKKQHKIIILIVAIVLGALYFMFPWSWSRWNPRWTIKGHEEIQDIKFTVTEKDADLVTAVVYLQVDGGYKKLPSKDIMTINDEIIQAEYYNNGVGAGYKYILNVPKNDEYVLVMRREGKLEITKTVTLHTESFPNDENVLD